MEGVERFSKTPQINAGAASRGVVVEETWVPSWQMRRQNGPITTDRVKSKVQLASGEKVGAAGANSEPAMPTTTY